MRTSQFNPIQMNIDLICVSYMEYLRDVAPPFRGINPTKEKKLLFTLLHVLIHLTRCRSWMARFNNKSADLSNFKSNQTILMNQYVNIVVFAITSRVLS